MPESLPPSVEKVQRALAAAGVDSRPVVLPGSTRTAADAAAAVGCDVAQIVKSIVFRRTDTHRAVLVMASGRNRVDEKLVSTHISAPIGKADADFVRAATGFAIGGVPPLGHEQPVELLMDEDLLDYDLVWAAAGTPNAVFSIGPATLARATGARIARIK